MPQRLLITGGTGFIGSALVKQRLAAGDQVTLYSRQPQAAIAQFQGQVRAFSDWQTLSPNSVFDAVINLAGSPVVGPRWSTARKQLLLESRVGTTEHLIAWLAQAQTRPAVLINGSAIGYYGCRGDEALDETAPPQSEFMSELCQQWEASANKAQALGLRVVCLRLGLVFCSQQDPGGALPKLVLPYYWGLGGKMGNGEQVMSWVHRDDVLAVISLAMADASFSGAYNLTAPQAPTQAQFAKAVGQALHRPTWLFTPAWLINALAGEMGALFTRGQRVIPQRLIEAGYRFKYPDLKSALDAYLGKK
ncbi:TIGR01777 family oxidoreductase [uncultured Deefgea sp.]|uniref:TIGR01777 family oxidoreductase n=1 Tax=uncultured Deefgea sp. TaxID=1304914 RepID=UPI00260FF439|nr:TIGR01777 family oxidoreductase [uncultured Deefgea sp.]